MNKHNRTISTFRMFSKLALTILLTTLLFGLQSPGAARAATLTVTKTADTNDGTCDADCSLREAIAAASSGDTITFAAGIAGGTITLGGTVLTIGKNLTITGPSAGMTIDGNSTSSVFRINSGTVEMSNLTITNGRGSQGGIRNNSTLTLNNCTVSGNTATGYGGGIFTDSNSTLTINNSTLSGNTSASGGGAIATYTNAAVTINNSTIANNTTSASGGGGGLDLDGSTTNVKNSILSGNSNGSGANNVVAYNGATITSQGYNLESGTDAGFTATGDQQSTDPKLLALADNGGPTKTHALDNGSPALEQIPFGTNGCGTTYTTDQRGEPRPGTKNQPNNKCEVGAWEAQTADPTAITLRGFSATATPSGVEVTWQTTSEVDTRGFNVWRSLQPVGGYEQLNADTIPALDPGGWSRNTYHYVDRTVLPGRTYYYRLEVIALDGSADWAGPVSVSSRFVVYLPMVYGSRP